MGDIKRRDLIQGLGLLAGAAAISGSARAAAAAPAQPVASVGGLPTYTVKPLPFDPKTLTGLSERILVSHHDNNYAGAVKRLNAITMQLAELDFAAAPTFTINGLKREELIAMNSMILHELYFASLAGTSAPKGKLAEALTHDFGRLERWQAQFSALGKAEGGGSGWTLLSFSPHDKRLVIHWAADHTMTLAGGRPILALDMYEHAYQMDYGAKAAAYVDTFMGMINWTNAGKLYDQYRKEV
jgi:Fe-Mn family superoxide dismutase